MIKRLTKHGNSYALVIDKPILELLNIDPETPIELRTDGRQLTITRAPDRAERVQSSVERINKKHAKALKRLAE